MYFFFFCYYYVQGWIGNQFTKVIHTLEMIYVRSAKYENKKTKDSF